MAMWNMFLKKTEDGMELNSDKEMLCFIPENYFSSKNAVVIGDKVKVLGVFAYKINNKGVETDKFNAFVFPTIIEMQPTSIEFRRDYELGKNFKKQDYRILKFTGKGAKVISSMKLVQDIEHVENMLRLFIISGHVNNIIPADELWSVLIQAGNLNGFGFPLVAQMFGFLSSEILRDPNDVTRPFRFSKVSDLHGYTAVGVKKLPKYVSAFSSFTSENFDEAMVSAVMNKNKVENPLEKILMT